MSETISEYVSFEPKMKNRFIVKFYNENGFYIQSYCIKSWKVELNASGHKYLFLERYITSEDSLDQVLGIVNDTNSTSIANIELLDHEGNISDKIKLSVKFYSLLLNGSWEQDEPMVAYYTFTIQ